jgi:integrase
MITKVNFYIQQTPGKEEATVRARISWGDRSITHSLGFSWAAKRWRKGNPCGTNAAGLSAARAKAEMSGLSRKCIEQIREDTTEAEAKAMLRGKEMPTTSIADITRKYLASRNLAYSSILNVRRVMSQLSDVCGSTVTSEGVETYISNCRQRMKAAAANTYVTILASVLSWARNEGLTNVKVESRPERDTRNQIIYLTDDEVRKIADVQLSEGSLQAERDRFLLQCLTGLRASDIAQLTSTIDNGNQIELTLIKTGQTVRIPLTEQSRLLFARIKSNRVPSTPRRVKLIKRICQLAGLDRAVVVSERRGGVQTSTQRHLWEVVGTHTARRTFISRLINAGVSTDVVMSMTGHRNYSGIRPYIGVSDSTKSAALDLISL